MYRKLAQKFIANFTKRRFTIAKQRFYAYFLRLPHNKIKRESHYVTYVHMTRQGWEKTL